MKKTFQKINGWRTWILIVIALGGWVYSLIFNYAITKNDIAHLQNAVTELRREVIELRQDIKDIYGYLIRP